VASLTQSPTIAQPLTAEGTIVGTFQYMSPEQLEGKEADARSDLWAFGCVLYEMATGRRAFDGKSQASLIGAIMNTEPAPISQIAPMTPVPLDRLVRACLAKSPDDRIQTAHDVKLQLQWIAEGGAQDSSQVSLAAVPVRKRARSRAATIAIAALSLACVIMAVQLLRSKSTDAPVIRAYIPAPEQTRFQLRGIHPGPPVLSPDGRWLAFAARSPQGDVVLWLRSLAETEAHALPGTEGAGYPFWSPDSKSVAFFSGAKLRKVDTAGGPPVVLCDAPIGKGGSWGSEGFILFAPGNLDPIHRVPEAGGQSVAVTSVDSTRNENSHRFPEILPDGRHFLYFARTGGLETTAGGAVMVSTIDGGASSLLMPSQAQASYAAGHLLFCRDGVLMVRPFDPDTAEFTGDAVPLVDAVHVIGGACYGAFSVSDNGVMVFVPPTSQSDLNLLMVSRTGALMDSLGRENYVSRPALSPSGRACVVTVADRSTGLSDLWLHDLNRLSATQLTFDAANQSSPLWSRDGARIFFSHGTNAVASMPIDGSAQSEILYESPSVAPLSWSPEADHLLIQTNTSKTRFDISLLAMAGLEAVPLLQTAANEAQGAFSPDGRWVVYSANDTGRPDVYVMPFPNTGRKWQVTARGGNNARWRGDGRELFYLALDGNIMSVSVEAHGSDLMLGRPQRLFQLSADGNFDVSADGQRFLVMTPAQKEEQPPLSLVFNWTSELDRR
jgi:Tol biopolymer transport system component